MKMDKNISEKLSKLLDVMEVQYSKVLVDHDEKDNVYRVNIQTDEPSIMIGHHGETIGAVQHLLKVLLWKDGGEQFNIVVDVDDYRKRQEDSVVELANRKIDALRESGTEQTFPPMSPFFRRLVHLYIAKDHTDVVSESSGEGDHRYVVIRMK